VPVLGPFAKLRKATVSFVMSVRPFDRMKKRGSQWTDFYEMFYFSILRKSVEKNSSFIYTLTGITATSHEDLCAFVIVYLRTLYRMRNVSQIKVVAKHTCYMQ